MPYECKYTVQIENLKTGAIATMGSRTTRSGTSMKVRRILDRAERNGRIAVADEWRFTRKDPEGNVEEYDRESGTWKVLIQ